MKILHATNALHRMLHGDSVCVKIMLYKLDAIGFELSKCAHAFAKSRCITTVADAISELHGVHIGARRSIEANTMGD